MKCLLPIVLAGLVLAQSTNAGETTLQHYGATTNAPFSAAVRAGDVLYVSGQIGVSPDGKLPDDLTLQAGYALDNVAQALKLAGATMDDVAKCTVMLTDMSQWSAFNAIYVGRFKPLKLPARSAIGANALALGSKVEIECIAYLPKD
ncbi:MAG: RidA family protein [Pseudoxanthomonas sp.]